MHRTSFPSPSFLVRGVMSPRRSRGTGAVALACVLALSASVHAQGVVDPELPADTSTSGAAGSTRATTGSTWTPGSGRMAIGLNLGRSNFQAPCGNVFACDDTEHYWAVYGRSMVNDNWGGEIGFVDMGDMARAGGTTRARGLNVSLVGKAPINQTFGVFGKVGAIYGRTRTSVGTGADIASGNEDGFGFSVGAGLNWDFSPRLSAVLQWDRYNFRFRSGRDPVNATSVGLQYRY